MKKVKIYTFVFLAALLSFYSFIFCYAAIPDKIDEEIKTGIYQYRQENYDEALATFSRLREAHPDNSLVAYYLGLTNKRMEDYIDARRELEASLAMTPKIKGALIELIDVLYRLDETEEAKKWIDVAEKEGVRPAQAAFLKGLTLFKSGELDRALQAFKDAKDLDVTLAPASNYHIGLIYVRQNKYQEAKGIFQDLATSAAGTDIEDYANLHLDELQRRVDQDQPLHFAARFAFEYDTNVTLKPDGTDLGEPISDKKDTREVYDVRTDYTFRSKDRSKSLKAGYGLRFSKENDLGEFDYLSNVFSLQPSMAFKRVLVSFPVYYTHDVVNSKNYLSAVTAGNVNNIMVTQNNMAQVGVTYQFNDYLRPPYGDENRSGNDIAETLGWFWFFNERKAFTTLRYTADQNLAHGDNWVYTGQRIDAGFMLPFWKRFEYSLNGQFYAKDFAHKHTVLNKKRHDQIYSLSSFLSYEFYKNMELQFQYTYINTRSTLSLYQYSRQILSGGVQYSF